VESNESTKSAVWEKVKAFCVIVLTSVIAIKIFTTPTQLTVDFPTLLSLLLALFSVALSALFYFKATDTSNTFYDNTYKFTRDIAQLLAKIESGFGERLRHLDEGYSSMSTYLQNLPYKGNEEVEKTKKKIENEKLELEKVKEERDKIIQSLVARSQLQDEEKRKFFTELEKKEEALKEAQREVQKLNKHLVVERIRRNQGRQISPQSRSEPSTDSGVAIYTRSQVLPLIGHEVLTGTSLGSIRKRFQELVPSLPEAYLNDLKGHSLYDGKLTVRGAIFLRKLARHAAE
jgi:hypothetical protein